MTHPTSNNTPPSPSAQSIHVCFQAGFQTHALNVKVLIIFQLLLLALGGCTWFENKLLLRAMCCVVSICHLVFWCIFYSMPNCFHSSQVNQICSTTIFSSSIPLFSFFYILISLLFFVVAAAAAAFRNVNQTFPELFHHIRLISQGKNLPYQIYQESKRRNSQLPTKISMWNWRQCLFSFYFAAITNFR